MARNDLEPRAGDSREQQENDGQLIASSYRGPIPPPELLGDYEQISPGSAERILKMAERDLAHRSQMESRALWLTYADNLLAKILTGGAIIGIVYLTMGGHEVIPGILAALIAVGPVARLVRWLFKIAGGNGD